VLFLLSPSSISHKSVRIGPSLRYNSILSVPLSSTVCGILGLLLHDPSVNAAPEICEGLSLLQHRGQDACGIVTGGPRGRLYQCKANGMVRDVFTQEAIARLIGGMGIGHGEHSFWSPPRSTLNTTPISNDAYHLHWLKGVAVGHVSRRHAGGSPNFRPPLNHARLLTTSLLHTLVRYPTAGSSHHAEAQPFYVNSPYGITFAHVSLTVFRLARRLTLKCYLGGRSTRTETLSTQRRS
jgi:glutamine phosphoribosylpyrophosphate amidotransferase